MRGVGGVRKSIHQSCYPRLQLVSNSLLYNKKGGMAGVIVGVIEFRVAKAKKKMKEVGKWMTLSRVGCVHAIKALRVSKSYMEILY